MKDNDINLMSVEEIADHLCKRQSVHLVIGWLDDHDEKFGWGFSSGETITAGIIEALRTRAHINMNNFFMNDEEQE